MIIMGIAAASAVGALLGGALFGGNQVRQNKKVMDAVYESMAAARKFEKTCEQIVAEAANTPTAEAVEAEVVEESSDSADDHCIYAVGDVVYVPDGVISQGGFAIRPGNYRIKRVDDEDILVIQKSKKTRTFRVRAEEVERRG